MTAPNVQTMGAEADEDDPQVQIFKLVRRFKFDEALSLLQESPSLWHEVDTDGHHSLLHWAALAGSIPFISHAISAHVEIDARSDNHQTPLMWAMTRGNTDAATLLLDAKADPCTKDSMGATPFILALQHAKHEAMLLLIARTSREEQLRSRDNNGCTAVHWAAYKGDNTAIRLLDYFNADFSVVDNDQLTPLHRAAQANQDQVCEVLLEKRVDPSHLDYKGRNALDLAREIPSAQMVALRLSRLLKEEKPSDDRRIDPEAGIGATLLRREKEEMEKIQLKAQKNAAASFWLICVSLAAFEYLTELRESAWTLAPSFAMAFELGVPACLGLFVAVAWADPGKVPPGRKNASGVEEILKTLRDGTSGKELLNFNRLCTSTFVIKGLRTKYCTQTKACVEEFDHFCGWLNVAIGKGNHRTFIFLAAAEVTVQFVHIILLVLTAKEQIEARSSSEWCYSLVMQYPLLTLVLIMHSFSSPGILMLLLNHLWLIAVNLTTNEMMNLQRYSHFWTEAPGDPKKVFRNPFDKGSKLKNCLDFWWLRQRGETLASLQEASNGKNS
eukprot:TRINITY_DN96495_c0_g1_i1.p1 TRINITY_DN96495_c0_g1~~TRINITY_DN96495_c0_g1_i1.p1  ORF type:complete len:557 (-),score=118.52 TRINITY_DN96495_c0_g1_i1:17-1687(-)